MKGFWYWLENTYIDWWGVKNWQTRLVLTGFAIVIGGIIAGVIYVGMEWGWWALIAHWMGRFHFPR